MADNTALNTGSGGDTIATDDIGGVKYPRSKIVIGADGTNDGDVSSANPLPVSLASVPSHAVTNAGTFAVQASQSGTWTVDLGATDNAVLDSILAALVGTLTVGSHAVTNAGTFAVQAAQSGTWHVTNISGTVSLPTGAATAAKQPALGTAGTASSDVITVQGVASMTALIVDGSGVTQPVSGTFWQATQPVSIAGTVTVDLGANNDVTVTNATAANLKCEATIAAAQTLATVTTVGTVTTVSTVTTCSTVTTLTGSAIAHDSADSGNPHKIGARAVTSVSAQTLVAANDRTDLLAGLDGVQITRQHCNLEDIVTATPVAITDGSSTSVLASPGAGLRNYITSIAIANSSATFVTVDLRDGTAGAVLWTFPVPPTGGVVYTFPVPLKFTAATAVAADPSAAASTITVSVNGFKSKV